LHVAYLAGAGDVVVDGLALGFASGLVKTSPMVLRCAASGVLGMYSAPRWPQAVKESNTQAHEI
jgi:hypothetical protein